MIKRIQRAATSVVAISVGLIPTAVSAQEAEDKADGEIIVTAQRREQAIIDVPLSVTALSRADLTRAQVDTLADYAALVPGFKALDGARQAART
ncbi:MAG: hypothetical protein HC788_00330 [Sphingopyxis sp.]|nr:hypothetical protein [Sphingopyxis sp.]